MADTIVFDKADKVVEWTHKGLHMGLSPQQMIFDGLSLGMKIVGDMYERNERFITDMIKSAKIMDKAMKILTPLLESAETGQARKETVVMGIVHENTQDIGKNLAVLMLKANGFNVIDLGKNVKPEKFVEAARANHAVAIDMSVMTNSSVTYAKKTVDLQKKEGAEGNYLLITGGSAMNEKIASELGIKYGSDANAAVSLVRQHIAKAT